MENTICKNCKRTYNDKRKPVLFPCGHNLCQKCLSKIMYAESSFFCPFDKQFLKLKQCRINVRLLNLAQKPSKEMPQAAGSGGNLKQKAQNPHEGSSICTNPLDIEHDTESINEETLSTVSTAEVSQTPMKSQKQSAYYSTPRFQQTPTCAKRVPQTIRRPVDPQPRQKKPDKARGTDVKNTPDTSFSFKNAALLTASIIGGVFLYSKVAKPSMKNAKSTGALLSTLKEVSGYSASSIVNLIKHS